MKDAKAKKVATTRVAKDKTRKVEEKDIKKRKPVLKETKAKKTRKSKKSAKVAKDPNQPKRPPTPFFLFLEQFRKTFKEDHPEAKGVAVVGKAGGEKWKEMSEFEKAPFMAKAQQKKQDYEKDIAAYNRQKQDDDEDDEGTAEESDKSKSEINDDDEESAEEEEDEEE